MHEMVGDQKLPSQIKRSRKSVSRNV